MRITESKNVFDAAMDKNCVFVKFDGMNILTEDEYENPLDNMNFTIVKKEWTFTMRTRYFGKKSKTILDEIYNKHTSLYLEKVVEKYKYYNWKAHIVSADVVDDVLEMRFVFTQMVPLSQTVPFYNDEDAVEFAIKMSETRMRFWTAGGNGWMNITAEVCE